MEAVEPQEPPPRTRASPPKPASRPYRPSQECADPRRHPPRLGDGPPLRRAPEPRLRPSSVLRRLQRLPPLPRPLGPALPPCADFPPGAGAPLPQQGALPPLPQPPGPALPPCADFLPGAGAPLPQRAALPPPFALPPPLSALRPLRLCGE